MSFADDRIVNISVSTKIDNIYVDDDVDKMNTACHFDLVLRNARVATASDTFDADIAVVGGRIVQLGTGVAGGAREVPTPAAEHGAQHAPMVVADFDDPGLAGLREALDTPVVGLTESALMSACMLDQPLASIGSVPDDQAAHLAALCERAFDEDGADVIVLVGAPLAGLARSLTGRLTVPVVDGVSSAARHAETLLALQSRQARRGSFAPAPEARSRAADGD